MAANKVKPWWTLSKRDLCWRTRSLCRLKGWKVVLLQQWLLTYCSQASPCASRDSLLRKEYWIVVCSFKSCVLVLLSQWLLRKSSLDEHSVRGDLCWFKSSKMQEWTDWSARAVVKCNRRGNTTALVVQEGITHSLHGCWRVSHSCGTTHTHTHTHDGAWPSRSVYLRRARSLATGTLTYDGHGHLWRERTPATGTDTCDGNA